jgi:mono/diheme cytochrome c family protein
MGNNIQFIFAMAITIFAAAQTHAARPGSLKHYRSTILPILQSKCFGCHGQDVQESDVRFDNLAIDFVEDRAAAQVWIEALHVINKSEMPPVDEPTLTTTERTTLVDWINGQIEHAQQTMKTNEGQVVLRRLNRTEYQHTMHDLLGLEMEYNRDLPPEGLSPDGFRNNGQSLQMSAIQIEYYLAAARRGLDRIIHTKPKPEVFSHTFEKSNVQNWFNVELSNQLGRSQGFYGKMVDDYPEHGDYLIRVKARAVVNEGRGPPILEASVGYRPDTEELWKVTSSLEITSKQSQIYEFRGRIENHPLPVRGQGKFPGLVVRIRNRYDDYSAKPKRQEVTVDGKKINAHPVEAGMPLIHIESVEFIGPVFTQWPTQRYREILFQSELRDQNESLYIEQVLERFMKRAFRRPVKRAEVAEMLAFYESIRPEFPNLEEAVKETLAMIMISPEFLYLTEPLAAKGRKLNDWELASRLSYFLWSTMPDQELFDHAENRTLSNPEILNSQIDRMLEDDRAWRFISQFTDQWLKTENIYHIAIDRDIYKGFAEELKQDMVGETRNFFRELLLQDLSALNFLDSDFTMLNEPLAKHYKIAGVTGRSFTKVSLADEDRRGGLLGQASVLMIGSTGQDSHPIRRAVWIRDRLLNDPPAPPPPDVPDLDSTNPDVAKLSVREQLAVHREKPSCAACHKSIDPWGIPLEHFDAVGKFRETIKIAKGGAILEREIVANDVLPDDHQLQGAESLKQYLLVQRKNDFARALATRLTIYALGRDIEWSDKHLIDELIQSFTTSDYRLKNLIKSIVNSDAFRTK